ncbi:MAG TPA: AmmeMemoRadiSam system protein B [bacterium]|nr:AmmeMemoRadiSam system protein B [bacterium]
MLFNSKITKYITIIMVLISMILRGQTREPVAAGRFYPGSKSNLQKTCQDYFQRAGNPKMKGKPIGIIAPHAGYVYSGRIAAISFNEIRDYDYSTVVIIAPSHTHSFSFASIYDGQFYKTPLGKVEIDQDKAREIASKSDRIKLSKNGHQSNSFGRGEHAVEVEIPFLQTIKPDQKIIPIVIGTLDYNVIKDLGNILGDLLKSDNILIVASSDLSHYHSYQEAEKIDQKLITALEKFDPNHFYEGIRDRKYEACGAAPIATMLLATKKAGSEKIEVLEYANSGDIQGGDKSRVVGYLSAAVTIGEQVNSNKIKEDKNMNNEARSQLNREEKIFLLELAEETMRAAVKNESKPDPENIPKITRQDRGAFVTLEKNGNLRGCIGYVQPIKPLWKAVKEMAVSAALKDPRFPPVEEDELKDITVEVSVLTVPHEIDDIEEIEVGKHGIIIKKGFQQGLLLPQVATDQGWDRRTFLQHTCRKAGLPTTAWQNQDTEIKIFSAQVFSHEELGD